MKPKIKFCGMTRSEDIETAEALGVDFIGLIFASSPRRIDLERAADLRKIAKQARVVGVFDTQSADEIETHVRTVGLDLVQLHGKPDLALARQMTVPVIQAFRGVPDAETLEAFVDACTYVLIDKADGETEIDLDAAASLPSSIRSRLFLAGGLTAENVKDIVDRMRPFAVDCARGIESEPGKKDRKLMREFSQVVSACSDEHSAAFLEDPRAGMPAPFGGKQMEKTGSRHSACGRTERITPFHHDLSNPSS